MHTHDNNWKLYYYIYYVQLTKEICMIQMKQINLFLYIHAVILYMVEEIPLYSLRDLETN